MRGAAMLIAVAMCRTLFAQEAVSVARGSSRDSPDETVEAKAVERAITFPVAFTTELLGNLKGGTAQRATVESLLNVGIALDLEKLAGWKGANLSIRAIYPEGSGLTSKAVHDFNTLSNIDSYDSFRLYDAWLQKDFGDGKVSVRIGQLLADAEFFDSDYSALFLNSSFGAIPLVSQNLNPPIFPTAAPGLRVRCEPVASFYAEAAVFSGDVGRAETTNKHNTRLSFRSADGALVFAEVGYLWNPKSKDATPAAQPTLSGSYKLSGYYDSKEFADNATAATHQGDYAVYLVVDQDLWHPEDNSERTVSCFVRGGFAPNDRNTVAGYGDAGFNYKGPWPGRRDDTLGLAFSYAQLSDQLLDDSGRRIPSHHEAVLEVTYDITYNTHLSIQPDLQVIFNPGAVRPTETAIVSGVRLNVEF